MKTPNYVKLAVCVLETVLELDPTPAPEGPMYLAFMAQGYSLEDWEFLVGVLVKKKLLTRSGHCLSVGEAVEDYKRIRAH